MIVVWRVIWVLVLVGAWTTLPKLRVAIGAVLGGEDPVNYHLGYVLGILLVVATLAWTFKRVWRRHSSSERGC